MEFVIGLISDFEAAGFNVDAWRKSTDGRAIVHKQYADVLITDYAAYQIYTAPSAALGDLLAAPAWSGEGEAI